MDILPLLKGTSVYKINIICLDWFHAAFGVHSAAGSLRVVPAGTQMISTSAPAFPGETQGKGRPTVPLSVGSVALCEG